MGGVATGIASKVFDVISKLLQLHFNDAFVRYGCQFCCNSFACIIVLLTQPMPGTILAKRTQVQLVSASELDVACYLVLYQWASRPLFQAMR